MNKEEKNQASPTALGLMKYVHAGFFTAGILLIWITIRILEAIWIAFPSIPYSEVVLHVIAVALAGGITFYCWRHPQLNRLSTEIVGELSKVTWPNRKETSASTVVVIITSCIAAMILGLFDMFWSWITDYIYYSG